VTLTRRDRAAMVLALECLRNYTHPLDARDAIQDAHAALGLPNFGNDGARVTLDLALAATLRETWVWDGRATRLLRARLALLLRVMLRVDKDDLRRWRCPEHGRRVAWDWHDGHGEEWWCAECRRWRIVKIDPPTCHIRPLWEIAAREAGR
jgi:hypothetical protein